MADTAIVGFQATLDKVLAGGGGDFLRQGLKLLTEFVMELEVSRQVGAEKGERSEDRQDSRNGYRSRQWDTRVGTLDLSVPRTRRVPYKPSFLEARTRVERALLSTIQQAYVDGVSTRKVEGLLQTLGLTGVSKSEVSRVCEGLDEHVAAFRERPLEGRYPYVWLDARYEKARVDGRVV